MANLLNLERVSKSYGVRPLLDTKDKIEVAIQLEHRLSSRPKSAKPQAGAARVTAIRLDDDLSRVVS